MELSCSEFHVQKMTELDDTIERLSNVDYDNGGMSNAEYDPSDHDIGQTHSRVYLTGMETRYIDDGAYSEQPRQNGMAKAVACVAITFLLICFVMVGASLYMSKTIDSKVRNSNEMLRKHNDRMAEGQIDTTSATNITSLL